MGSHLALQKTSEAKTTLSTSTLVGDNSQLSKPLSISDLKNLNSLETSNFFNSKNANFLNSIVSSGGRLIQETLDQYKVRTTNKLPNVSNQIPFETNLTTELSFLVSPHTESSQPKPLSFFRRSILASPVNFPSKSAVYKKLDTTDFKAPTPSPINTLISPQSGYKSTLCVQKLPDILNLKPLVNKTRRTVPTKDLAKALPFNENLFKPTNPGQFAALLQPLTRAALNLGKSTSTL
jgi:hypothetical protein